MPLLGDLLPLLLQQISLLVESMSFPLISDHDGSLRKLFAVPSALGLLPGRSTYVIDNEGLVRLIFSAQFASDKYVQQALNVVTSQA